MQVIKFHKRNPVSNIISNSLDELFKLIFKISNETLEHDPLSLTISLIEYIKYQQDILLIPFVKKCGPIIEHFDLFSSLLCCSPHTLCMVVLYGLISNLLDIH